MIEREKGDIKKERQREREEEENMKERKKGRIKEINNDRKPKCLTLECLTLYNASTTNSFPLPLGIIITSLARLPHEKVFSVIIVILTIFASSLERR